MWCLLTGYRDLSFCNVFQYYTSQTLKKNSVYDMNRRLLFGLLGLGIAMIVAGLVIVFVGLP
jgi:uncharacterized membrane protein